MFDELVSLKKTQEEIDSLSDEELNELNNKVHNYAIEKGNQITRLLQRRESYIRYAVEMYKKLRKDKVEYPFWRCKGLVELVLFDLGLQAKKITTGFTITIGDTSEDLYSVIIKPIKDKYDVQGYFNYKSFESEIWYRVYKKTKVRTPEEQAAFDEEIKQKIKEKYRKQWIKNCEKFGCKPEQFDKRFRDKETGDVFLVEGLKPRQKKYPISCMKWDKTGKELGYYALTVRYFNTLEEIKEGM